MKRCALWLLGLLVLGALPASAQYTSNYQTNTFIGYLIDEWVYTNYLVGNTTYCNGLVIKDGAELHTYNYQGILLTNAVGYGSSAVNCGILVSGADALFHPTGLLCIGWAGRNATLTILNGGRTWHYNGDAIVGGTPGAYSNAVVVSGTNALWTTTDITIGKSSVGNSLLITNRGAVDGYSGCIGQSAAGSSNAVVVTGTGSLWSSRGILCVGDNASTANSLRIAAGGVVSNVSGFVGRNSGGNSVVVSGSNSLWRSGGVATIGSAGNSNALSVLDGGTAIAASIVVGESSTGNLIVVSNATLTTTLLTVNASNTVAGSGTISSSLVNYGLLEANRSGVALKFYGQTLNYGELRASNGGVMEFFGPVLDYGSINTNGGTVVFHDVYLAGNGGTNSWTDTSSGLWTNAAVWSLGRAPTVSDSLVLITNDSAKVVELDSLSNGNGNYGVVVGGVSNTWRIRDLSGPFNVLELTITNGARLEVTNAALNVGILGLGRLDLDGSVLVQAGSLNAGTVTNQVGGTTSSEITVQDGGSYSASELFLGVDTAGNRLNILGTGVVSSVDSLVGLGAASSSNVVVVQGPGAVWGMTSNLVLGVAGADNAMLIADGGRVNNHTGIVGYAASATNCSVVVTGAGSVWSNRADLYLGYAGANASLTISNRGGVNSVTTYVGYNTSATSNAVVLTGPGSTWTNTGTLYFGHAGGGNTLVLTNGAVLQSTETHIGNQTSADNNRVVVTGTGTVLRTAGYWFDIGSGSGGNTLLVNDGGAVRCNATFGMRLGVSGGDGSNQIVVAGPGSSVAGTYLFFFGGGTSGNSLLISNSGTVSSGNVYMNGTGNFAEITGTGSAWNVGWLNIQSGTSNGVIVRDGATGSSGALTVGDGGSYGSFIITDTGTVWRAGGLIAGHYGVGGTVLVSNGAALYSSSCSLGEHPGLAKSNRVIVTGSLWDNQQGTIVFAGTDEAIVATNATMITGSLTLSGSGNEVKIYGSRLTVTNGMGTGSLSTSSGTRLELFNSQLTADRLVVASNTLAFGGNLELRTGAGTLDISTNRWLMGDADGTTMDWLMHDGLHTLVASQVVIGAASGGVARLTITNANFYVSSVIYVGSNAVGNGRGSLNMTNSTLSAAGLVSGFDGTGTITNVGGMFLFNTATPEVTANATGSIVGINAGLGFHAVSNAPINLPGIEWHGSTRYRLDAASNAMLGAYSFGDGCPDGYSQLEMFSGATLWRSSNLVIAANGTLVISNTVAAFDIADQQFLVTNGARVDYSAGINGFNANATNFTVALTGTNAVWATTGDFSLGRVGGTNSVLIDGALWSNSRDYWVGDGSAGNQLIVTDGGLLNDRLGYIGAQSNANNNTVWVVGVGSVWSNSGKLRIGSGGDIPAEAPDSNYGGKGGDSNRLLIADGGNVFSAGGAVGVGGKGQQGGSLYDVPGGAAGNGNSVAVVGSGSLWSNSAAISIGGGGDGGHVGGGGSTVPLGTGGRGGNGNVLLISAGGVVFSTYADIGAGGMPGGGAGGPGGPGGRGGDNNFATITGSGSVWYATSELRIGAGNNSPIFYYYGGDGGFSNRVVIADGGIVCSAGGRIGAGGDAFSLGYGRGGSGGTSNSLLLTGTGTLWQSIGNVSVGADGVQAVGGPQVACGYGGTGNTMRVENGARVTVAGTLTVGGDNGGFGNSLTTDAGRLSVTGRVSVLGTLSTLSLSNSAEATFGGLLVGDLMGGGTNLASVVDSSLTLTNPTGVSVGQVMQGMLRMQNSTVTTDYLIATNRYQGLFYFDSGTLTTTKRFTLDYGTNQFRVGTIPGQAALWTATGVTNSVVTAQWVIGATAGATASVNVTGHVLSVEGIVCVGSNVYGHGSGELIVSGHVFRTSGFVGGQNGTSNIRFTGDVLSFNVGQPTLTYYTPGEMVVSNVTVLEFYHCTNAVVNWRSTGMTNIVWQNSPVIYRLNNATNQFVGNYGFGDANSQGYRTLELFGTNALWQSSNLVVGANGNLVISNAAVAIQTVDQRLSLINGGSGTNYTGPGGFNPNTSGFTILLDGPDTSWTGDMTVGYRGSGNTLIITNGAKLHGPISVGYISNANNNAVVLTGNGTVWSNNANLYVGLGGSTNSFTIKDGGVVSNFGSGWNVIGNNATSVCNRLEVTGSGSALTSSRTLKVGAAGNANSLFINAGGLVAGINSYIGENSQSNWAMVTGLGSVWTNSGEMVVGQNGYANWLVVSNGAAVYGANGYVGNSSGASNNDAVVTGVGTTWGCSSNFYLGKGGPRNNLTISAGAVVSAMNGYIGYEATGKKNYLLVTGGGSSFLQSQDLYVGYASADNGIDVRNGGLLRAQNSYIGWSNTAAHNSVGVNGSGSMWENSADVFVGYSSTNNSVSVSGGGQLTSRIGYLGYSAGAKGNSISIAGSGTTWDIGSNLFIGYRSSTNSLTIDGGAVVQNETGYIGFASTANGNNVYVTNGAVWSNRSRVVYVGYDGSGNGLTVSGGSRLYTDDGLIGFSATARSNVVTVANAGSTWSIANNMYVGFGGAGNRLVVSDQGLVLDDTAYLGFYTTGNNGTVADAGSLWNNRVALYIGYEAGSNRLTLTGGAASAPELVVGWHSAGNSLVITNGGILCDTTAFLGDSATTSSGNLAVVTGSGSAWLTDGNLEIGRASSSNELRLFNAGTAVASNLWLGTGASSNRILVAGGALVVTNGNLNGTLDVRQGAFVMNGGTALTDILLLTNSSGRGVLNLYSGTLTSHGSTFANGYPLLIGETGTGGACFAAAGGKHLVDGDVFVGSESARNTLIVSNGATLRNRQAFLGYTDSSSNNAALITGSGSTWSNAFDIQIGYVGRSNRVTVAGGSVVASNLFVGRSGVLNALIVTNVGRVTTEAGYVGYEAGSISNVVIVTGAGSVWTNRQDFVLGNLGGGNTATISAGGALYASHGYIGYQSGAGQNRISVTGTNSLWMIESDLYVGYAADAGNNNLVVSNAGWLVNTTGYIGYNASSNSVTVASTASVWSNRADVYVGYLGISNRLTVAGGNVVATNLFIGKDGALNAFVLSGSGQVQVVNSYIGHGVSSSNNAALAGGTGSLWSNSQNLYVGYGSGANSLTISNGSSVQNEFGYVGYNSTAGSNLVLVTGANAVWVNRQTLEVGHLSDGNELRVTNAGTVVASNLVLGASATGTGNQITLAGGRLLVTNALATGELNVRRGSLVFNGGTITLDRLVLTNVSDGGTMVFNRGTLTNRSTVASSTSAFSIGTTGAGGAVFVGLVGNHSFGGNLLVGSQSVANALVLTGGAQMQNESGYLGYGSSSGGNYGTVTGSGSVWSNRGDLYVGYLGVSNRFTVAAGGLAQAQNGYVGFGTYSSNNVGTVTGAGSVWSNRNDIHVGYSGSSNSVVLTSGGALYSTTGYVGRLAGASRNRMQVTGSGSAWVNDADLFIGYAAGSSSNSLVVTNGGKVVNYHGYVGYLGDNNSAFVVGSSAVWSNQGNLYVGHTGGSNTLFVGASGRVQDGYGYVGYGASSTGNTIVVNGSSAIWSNQYDVAIGQAGAGNSMLVTNSGRVLDAQGTVGSIQSSSGNVVLVTGSSSYWTNTANLFLGENGAGNQLAITAGGKVHNATGYVGFAVSSTGNQMSVAGNGSLWNNRFDLYVGSAGAAQSLTITETGVVRDITGYVGYAASSSNNTVSISTGGVWSNNTLYVGYAGLGNTLTLTNDGYLKSITGYVGYAESADSNSVVITGGAWSNSASLYVGYAGSDNRLTIAGGTVLSTNLVVVGDSAAASNNTLQLNGGQLIVTNTARIANLVLGRTGQGRLVLNSGAAIVDILVATNGVNSVIQFNGGALNIRQAAVTNGATLAVGDGTRSATLNVLGGTLALANGAVIRNAATLTGSGTVTGGAALNNGATLAPGNSIGTLNVVGGLSLSANSLLRFEAGAIGVNDLVQVTGNLAIGGTLTIVDLSGFTSGTYTLFTYTGTLSTNSFVRVAPLSSNFTGIVNYGTGSNSTVNLVTATGMDPYVEYGYYYFGTTNDFGAATADPDGDGMSNEKEFIAGTDPLNPQSVLRVTNIKMTGNDVVVTWQTSGGDAMFSTAGKTNVIEWTDDLRAGFSNTLATIHLPCCGDAVTNLTDNSAGGVKARFYRVRVLP